MEPGSIELQNVRKHYGGSAAPCIAISGVSLSIFPGEVTILMGPSGSGKSTLMSMIGGVLQPTSGTVVVAGCALHECDESRLQKFRRQHIGFVFQNYNLLSSLTALENIQVALSLRGENSACAMQLLEQVGMAKKAHAFPDALSGGQRQRIGVARALAGNPPVLLADEPTAALDAVYGTRIMELLRRRAKKDGTTVVVITHDPRVREFGCRVIDMEDGRIKRIVRRVRPENAPSANCRDAQR
jgi:putative ABC transport system ATP-binding protein